MADLAPDIISSFSEIRFANSIAIDSFFQDRKDKHYITWFNDTLANRGVWAGVRLVSNPANEIGFHQFWNQIDHIFGADISLIQFIALMSIISNEVRGNFTPVAERMGVAGHPGMAYLFDHIGSKRSYNTLAGNQTALTCFQNENYIAAHSALPLADQLIDATDPQWAGEVWPVAFDTTPKGTFIEQADFMKFRGRGFIQTTGRGNYNGLIEFVKNYDGENSTLDFFQHRWSGKTTDEIAFETTNQNWDALFQSTDLIVASEAVRLHNARSGNYLNLSTDPETLNGTGPGSIHRMGLSISGGQTYAAKFKDRVAAVAVAI